MNAQTARPAPPGARSAGSSTDESVPRPLLPRDRGPELALVALVVVAAVAYGIAAQVVEMPLVNPDELRYRLAAQAVVDGEWLNLRGHAYEYGPVYPLLLATILALAGNVDAAYPFFKLANALLFALAAVPIYLLARRLLPPWWGVAVAAASLAIPSSIYTSFVFTESASYLTASVALLAVVLALERPSVARQLAMLGAVVVAAATRPQFAAFVPAFLAGWLLLELLDAWRPPLARSAVRLWPTFAAMAVGLAAVAARLLTHPSAEESEGGYGDLWRGYDVLEVARLVVYHLAGWELYLFVAPFVVAPIVVHSLLGAARRGARREGAFVAAFLTVNTALIVITAAFASTPFGYSELHDRYLFYLAPLWLIAFGAWLAAELPRPVWPATVGVVAALVLPAVVPFGLIAGNIVFESVPTAFWTWVWDVVEGTPHVDGRRMLGVIVVVLVVLTVALPRRLWPVLPAVVASGLLYMSVLAWDREADTPDAFVAADAADRAWVDDAVTRRSRVTTLYVSPPDCPYSELTRHALFLTEFFNPSIGRVVTPVDSAGDGLPVDRVEVDAGDRLVVDGTPLVADYVVTQPEVALAGRRVARATGANLVLWETSGAVRLADDDADILRLARDACD